MRRQMFAMILMAACAGAAQAQVYKCPDADGRTVLQQIPCVDGVKLTIKPATGPAPDVIRSSGRGPARQSAAPSSTTQQRDDPRAARVRDMLERQKTLRETGPQDLVQVLLDGKWGYINAQGEMVITPQFTHQEDGCMGTSLEPGCRAGVFAANGLAAVKVSAGSWGYIDVRGRMVIPPIFQAAHNFSANGLAAVLLQGGKKWGYIDNLGQMVIPARFDWANDFGPNGLALVKKRGKQVGEDKSGYINARGEIVIPPKFDFGSNFSTNGLAAVRENKTTGYINAQGEMVTVLPASISWTTGFAENGLAAFAVKNGFDYKIGYMNAKGEVVIPAKFDQLPPPLIMMGDLYFPVNGLSLVYEGDKFGYVNVRGEMVVPARFEYAYDFSPLGLAAVKEDGKLGYIDTKGKMVIAPRFTKAWAFNLNGLARVIDKGKDSYIDVQGQTIVFVDRVCNIDVLKNGRGEITWPRKTPEQICGQQPARPQGCGAEQGQPCAVTTSAQAPLPALPVTAQGRGGKAEDMVLIRVGDKAGYINT